MHFAKIGFREYQSNFRIIRSRRRLSWVLLLEKNRTFFHSKLNARKVKKLVGLDSSVFKRLILASKSFTVISRRFIFVNWRNVLIYVKFVKINEIPLPIILRPGKTLKFSESFKKFLKC